MASSNLPLILRLEVNFAVTLPVLRLKVPEQLSVGVNQRASIGRHGRARGTTKRNKLPA